MPPPEDLKPKRIEATKPAEFTRQPVERTQAGVARTRGDARNLARRADAREATARPRDQFRGASMREQLAQRISRRMQQAQALAGLLLRLPGRDRVLEDRRTPPERRAAEPEDARMRKAGEARTGDSREKSERADREKSEHVRDPHAFAGDQAASPRRTERTMNPATAQILADLAVAEAQSAEGAVTHGGAGPDAAQLTSFEQAIVERFEQGLAHAQSTANGTATLAPKNAAEWKNFFAQFLARTEKRQIPLDAVADALLFRGLLQKKGADGVGIFIGDVPLTSGALEKFARFEVSLQQMLQYVQHLAPGATIDKQLVAQALASELLEYFAIAPDTENRAFAGGMLDQGGIFTSRRVESELATALGIPQRYATPHESTTSASHAPRGVKGLGLGSDSESGNSATEDPLDLWRRFLPWHRIERDERIGERRWFVTVTWFTIISVGLIALWILARNFL